MSVEILSIGQTGDSERTIYTDFADIERWTIYKLRTTSELDGPIQVLNAPGIPQPGDPFLSGVDVDPNSYCVQRIAERDPAVWNHWTVRCRYTTNNPLLEPVQLEVTSEPIKEALSQDVNGDNILNSAGDPFDPPFEVDDCRLVLTATHNVPTIQPEIVAMYLQDGGAINSDQFWGFDPGFVKTAKYRARAFPKAFPNYWQETWEFWIDLSGWTLQVLDRGFNYLQTVVPLVPQKVQIRDGVGNMPFAKPSLLDGHGNVLPANAAAVYLSFNVYNTLPFQALGLGI